VTVSERNRSIGDSPPIQSGGHGQHAAVDEPWAARFRATRLSLPEWARDRPERCLYLSNRSGVFELYAWDRSTDTHRQVTDRPNGTADGAISPSGTQIWWFDDTDGDEFGVWRREPFDVTESDAPAPAEAAVPGLPAAYAAGLAIGRTRTAIGSSGEQGSSIVVCEPDGQLIELYRTAGDASLAALSEDETLLVIEHSEHGDALHPDLRAIRVSDGATVADLSDGPGRGLSAVDFSPVSGDQRVLVTHERSGRAELLVWDVGSGETSELPPPPDGGEVADADWYPDGRSVLVASDHAARVSLYRHDLGPSIWTTLDVPAGVVASAGVRPDTSVEYSWSDSATPPALRVAGRSEPLLVPPGPAAPAAAPLRDEWIEGPGGAVHALVASPPSGLGPQATVFLLHGGPHWLDADSFSATRAAYVDAGYVVVHVNYRGSTGYGSEWRDAIIGRPGLTELEDVAVVQDWAVSSGLADRARCVIAGASWGGYLCLLGLGTQPGRWAAGVAGVPVADYVSAFADEMEQLQAVDRALFGGTPDEVPERFVRSSPISYAEYVRAPVLVMYGRNDPRCPERQVERYLARLAELRVPWEEYRFDAGHGSLVVEERITQMRIELDFVRRHVPA
jgi:Tol biopolymer transport system component/dienelactone hydrolase